MHTHSNCFLQFWVILDSLKSKLKPIKVHWTHLLNQNYNEVYYLTAVRMAVIFFNKLFYFILFFGYIGSSLLHASFSLVAVSRGYSSLRCVGFSLQWLLLLRSTGFRHVGFSSCGMRAQ